MTRLCHIPIHSPLRRDRAGSIRALAWIAWVALMSPTAACVAVPDGNRAPCADTLGRSAACAALDCAAAVDSSGVSGRYWLRPLADAAPREAYCTAIAGSGWQLISARRESTGGLFGTQMCLDPNENCSGTIPADQISPDRQLHLLIATHHDATWITLSNLGPPGSDGLLDAITGARPLSESPSCEYPHFCGPVGDIESAMRLADHSPNFTPRYDRCAYIWLTSGGIYCGENGNQDGHVLSINVAPYCGEGGVELSGTSTDDFGDISCGKPGAIYFRYE